MSDVLALLAAGIVTAWGVSHIVPTRQVVAGFGDIGTDNRYIITMEWVVEALGFFFAAAVVASVAVADVGEAASDLLYRLTAGFLVVIGVWTAMTGARTRVIWFKMCPVVMSVSATLLIVASLV